MDLKSSFSFSRAKIGVQRRLRSVHIRTLLASMLTVGLLTAVISPPAQAISPAPAASSVAKDATRNLLTAHDQYQKASPAARPQALNTLLATAKERQQELALLIRENPGDVLQVALPEAIRASLPSAVQPYVEQTVQLEGTLEVLMEHVHPGSILRYALVTGAKRTTLHFADAPPVNLFTGAQVRVRGVQVDTALALDSGSTSVQTLSLLVPNTFGVQKTLVILVNFQDKTTQPYTPSTAQNLIFTTTSSFDMENSYGQTSLTGDVVGWYTIPLSYTVCNSSSLATYAKEAATAAGVNLANYTRYVYAFPDNACTWWGLGSVGGSPSQAWINGSLANKVVAHEMGHNFGLYHSNAWECGSETLGSTCSSVEYGDTVDTMGNPSSGHFNAFQKERLGWLNYGASPPITTVQTSGSYTIDPLETPTLNPKALKILKSTDATTGKKTWYYVEFRRPVGFDSFVSSKSNTMNGVIVHTGSEASANSSYLLDMKPTTTSWSDPALTVGQTFYDAVSGVTILLTAVSSTGATVSVNFGPLACVRANPTVTMSPSATQWVKPGTSVTYTVTVTNTDNSGCSPSAFALQTAVPSGWTGAWGSSALTIASGASLSTTLTVTSPTAAVDGFYTIGATTTNSAAAGFTASTTVTQSLLSSLGVSVTTSQASYTRSQTVASTATVTTNGQPLANVSVGFTITKANGSTVTGSAVTAANGVATYNYRFKRQDPTGTYQVKANASMSNVSGSATATFAVQ